MTKTRSYRSPSALWILLPVTAFLFGLPLAGRARAAQARDELLRLVPDDVGFGLVLQDLRRHSQLFLGSPFMEEFRRSPLGLAIKNAPQTEKLAAVEKLFQTYLHVDGARLRDDIFGDAMILAYRPGPPGKPELEQGLILI